MGRAPKADRETKGNYGGMSNTDRTASQALGT